MAAPLRIEVVSDVICPWCLLGTRRLDRALAALPDVVADVVYLPFFLDPSIDPSLDPSRAPQAPVEQAVRRDLRPPRYGDPAPLLRRVEAAARADGIDLDLARVGRTESSVRAHTVLRHARARGSQRALARALFGAHFLEGRDVSDLDVLENLARSHAFAAGEARALALDPAEEATTREQAHAAAEKGVSGVPFVTIGEGGITIAGAQPVAVFQRAIAAAAAR